MYYDEGTTPPPTGGTPMSPTPSRPDARAVPHAPLLAVLVAALTLLLAGPPTAASQRAGQRPDHPAKLEHRFVTLFLDDMAR